MPRNIAPSTVSSESDLVEYYVSDASPVETTSPAGYAERHIHSGIYKKYRSVQSVIHSHCSAVTPYTVSCNRSSFKALDGCLTDHLLAVPLRPCFHMAGFLGKRSAWKRVSQNLTALQAPRLLSLTSQNTIPWKTLETYSFAKPVLHQL